MNASKNPHDNSQNQPLRNQPPNNHRNPLNKFLSKPLFHIAFWLVFILYELLIFHVTEGSPYFFPDIFCNYLVNIASVTPLFTAFSAPAGIKNQYRCSYY